MPPTRRYLRLTAHSVLEVRIYLDNPTDTHRWLLHPSKPALPSIISAVRPLVLPKLKEENARAAGKGGGAKGGGSGSNKKKGWKDVVQTDDFEVVVFLTDNSVRHSILKREKVVHMKGDKGTRNHGLSGSKEDPVMVGEGDAGPPGLLREDEEDDGPSLRDIPVAAAESTDRQTGDALFVSDDEEDEVADTGRIERNAQDDKKKLALDTTYDGFSIYGRILCLVVKRKGTAKGKTASGGSGQAMMEEWISSTQMGEGGMMDE